MITLTRTTNYDLVRKLFTLSYVYPKITDDFAPPREQFVVNQHPGIWYVVATAEDEVVVALFTLAPFNNVCWDGHAIAFPWAGKRQRWEAARALIPWLEQNTPCKRLVAACPDYNREALVYGMRGAGLEHAGRHPKAILKDGKLHDLILLGRAIGTNGG